MLVVGELGERGLLGLGRDVLGAGVERVEADAVVVGDLLVVGVGDQVQVGDAGGRRRCGLGVSGRALGWAWRVIRNGTAWP